jgi:hypothetical protein
MPGDLTVDPQRLTLTWRNTELARVQTSCDPTDWRVYHALAAAEQAAARELTERWEGSAPADTSDLPPWSQVSEPGMSDRGPFTPPPV